VRSRSRQRSDFTRGAGGLSAAISRHPREFVGMLAATIGIFAIYFNALFLQRGPHPAPIFAARPMPTLQSVPVSPRPHAVAPVVAPETPARSRTQIIADIQRELSRHGFYGGAADGIWGAKADAAARDFVQAAGLKINPEATDNLLHAIAASATKAQGPHTIAAKPAPNDPIAELIAPPKRVLAIQRALTDFGFGQIKPTGIEDADTRAAIEKFERDRNLPITGKMSDRVVRDLAAMTGRPLE
jgi:Putative peptidoglycan binding domain